MSATYEQMTGISSATALTNVPAGANSAEIQVEGGAIRYRLDATDPTTAVGVQVAKGESFNIPDATADLNDVRVIQESGTAILNIHYIE